jgi:hypothetical protein
MFSVHLPHRPPSGADTAAAPPSLLAWAALVLLVCVALALLGVPPPAFAQPAAKADPLNAKAVVPPAAYRSAFSSYRPSSETPVGSWREANDTVTRIGGWRVYAREANQPEAPAGSTGSNPPPAGATRAKP